MYSSLPDIKPLTGGLKTKLEQKIINKTKPPGSLGKLENLAFQLGLIQNSLNINLHYPHILIFAADHGITHEGVSAYPQEVTRQMVQNFLTGGGAINVFAKQHDITLKIIDAGVNYDFQVNKTPFNNSFLHAKIGYGTSNFLKEPAMTSQQCEKALNEGINILDKISENGCNVIGFGEMGIGNTASASMLMSKFCQLPLENCVGTGTGLNDKGYSRKLKVLQQALAHHQLKEKCTPEKVLATFGGFEICMICGAMLRAANLGMAILVDGFITTTALLCAWKLNPNILGYCIFSHVSAEKGHQKLLDHLNAEPLLQLDMRLGEGTGAALAYPLLVSAQNFLNEMASFESAGVSDKTN